MKILLVGEFSGVHTNLADGLKQLGHQVSIAATGDGYRKFPYDYFLGCEIGKDNSLSKQKFKINTRLSLSKNKKIFFDNDIVQLINPIFHVSDLVLMNLFTFSLLKQKNRKVFLGGFGDDYYWMKGCIDGLFRYDPISSNLINHTPDEHFYYAFHNCFNLPSKRLNEYIARQADGIITGAFEYQHTYLNSEYAHKTNFIPFPINTDKIPYIENVVKNGKIKILLGKQKGRNNWKGINVLEKVLDRLVVKYPNDIELTKCESLPFEEYKKLYQETNIVVDQLYSYSPAMNALNALAAGKVVLGGGEPEAYDLLGEKNNTPIFNILPDKIQIENTVLSLIDHRRNIAAIGYNGRRFIEEHHCYLKVAERYLNVWK